MQVNPPIIKQHFKKGANMEAYKAILEALAEAECITYYQTDDPKHGDSIKEINNELKQIIKKWHDLTGATLD